MVIEVYGQVEFSDVNRDNTKTPMTPMTEINMDLSELLATQDGGDFLRGVAEAVPQPIVEADGDGPIGAGRHERSADRATLNMKVSKPHEGSYVPGFPEPRKPPRRPRWPSSKRLGLAVCPRAMSMRWHRPWE